jgi:hypothetical protein
VPDLAAVGFDIAERVLLSDAASGGAGEPATPTNRRSQAWRGKARTSPGCSRSGGWRYLFSGSLYWVALRGSLDAQTVVYVDDVRLAETRHRGRLGEVIGIGLFAYSQAGGTDVRFDDVLVRPLPD